MPEMEKIKIVYKLNGCNASATDLQAIGNQEDKGKLQVYFAYFVFDDNNK